MRQAQKGELYFVEDSVVMCNDDTLGRYPIYKAVEEIIDVPLWRGEKGAWYYSIYSSGNIYKNMENNEQSDDERYDFGNVFNGEDECRKYRKLIKFILTERLLDNPEFSALIEKLKGELL